ncbi:hypothetical protein SCFA_900007 [anaerobic digester metagenome]|uniref:Uncharacterized protein n=1 Tax=anaerobic digester metagenome TaxID=1263854 RepID=A0A485MCV0_9ZZZZ
MTSLRVPELHRPGARLVEFLKMRPIMNDLLACEVNRRLRSYSNIHIRQISLQIFCAL